MSNNPFPFYLQFLLSPKQVRLQYWYSVRDNRDSKLGVVTMIKSHDNSKSRYNLYYIH